MFKEKSPPKIVQPGSLPFKSEKEKKVKRKLVFTKNQQKLRKNLSPVNLPERNSLEGKKTIQVKNSYLNKESKNVRNKRRQNKIFYSSYSKFTNNLFKIITAAVDSMTRTQEY